MNRKPRILFVDDEPNLLQALQRSLRPMRKDWEMEFADGGAKALAAMEKSPFDMVVSDMKMPGMSGCDLLDEVMERYPATLRFILSGHAEQAQVMQCVGPTHQFLAKPCETEKLTTSLKRAAELEHLVPDAELRQLLTRLDRIPCAPVRLESLQSALGCPEPSLERIAAIVSEDPGLTALTLKIANSAFFGNTRNNLDVELATTQLGADVIKSLTLTLKLFSPLQLQSCHAFDPAAYWRHSLSAGNAMRRIVEMHGCKGLNSREAFVIGLLLDVGQLVLATHLGHRYSQISREQISQPGGLAAAEKMHFGVTHAEVGAFLLGTWGFPEVIVETVANHHQPTASRVENPSALAIASIVGASVDCLDTNKQLLSELEELRTSPNASSVESWVNICREVAA